MIASAPRLDRLISSVYDAVVEPSGWCDVMTEMSDLVGAHQAIMLTADIATGKSTAMTCRRLELSAIDNFFSYYMFINPLVLVDDVDDYTAGWRPIMLRDEDCLDRAALEATEYYNDYLRPLDAGYMLSLRLGLDGQSLTSISLGNSLARGRFEDEAMTTLAAVHPHAIRAAGLARRFAGLQQFAAGASAAMDAASNPLLLLDAEGRVVHANDSAERMLSAQLMLRAPAGRLASIGQQASSDLARALMSAAKPQGRSGGTVSLVDAEGRRTAQASVVPIALEAGIAMASGPAVLVSVAPLTDAERIDAALDGYGLTRAERSLATALVDGMTLRAAAAARGISFHTARHQLAALFGKTGVNRQVDLVQLLTRAH